MKRGISLYISLCLLLSGVLYKIVSLNFSPYAKTGTAYSSKTLLIGETRGNIYDTNLNKLVSKEEKLVCAAKPGAYSLSYLKNSKIKNKDELTSQLTKGFPVIFEVSEMVQNDDMETFSVPKRYTDNTLCHIIGYTDGTSHGVCGIEKSFDSFLTDESGSLSVTFDTDANGKVLTGIVPRVTDNNYNSQAGVVLTVDEEIQKITEKAMNDSKIESGACVILSAKDAAISAMVSVPKYSRDNLGDALKGENSPLVNKALSAYAVGSVFKPVIAAAALENGIKPEREYKCTGSEEIGGIHYSCNNKTAHGKEDLRSALEMSCNAYFVNLSKKLKSEKLYDFCTSLGFSESTELCGGIIAESGIFPEADELKNKGEKANFSFGQGHFTATPVQLAAAYLAIANSGQYKYPYLIKGTVDRDGIFTENERKPDSRVMSENTANIIRDDLISVVENGNAYNAQCSLCTVAGKTGTAQSGSYDELGNEILRTWFVGFFPANEPLFSVAILSENGTSGAHDCAPVFCEIAENAMKLMIERANTK